MEINLKRKIAELERELSRRKERDNHPESHSELSKFVASQEVENHKAISLILNKMVTRLEEDCRGLRTRELSDRETMKGLMDKLEKNDRDFKGKLLEMELGNQKLEAEVLEWKNKHYELEARASKIVDERKERGLREKLVRLAEENRDREARALRVSEENCSLKGKRNAGKKFHSNERERVHTSEIDEEGETPLRSFTKKRTIAEVCEGDKKDSHSLRESSAPAKRREQHGINQGAIKVEEVREGVCRNFQESNKGARLGKKFKKSDLSCSLTKINRRTTARGCVADKGTKSRNQRNYNNQKSRAYTGRTPSREQLEHAEKRAEIFLRSLKSCKPLFIKSMGWSHVSGPFWFSMPRTFCKENLPAHDVKMILEDERSLEYEVKYIAHSLALSGGWRGFAMAHKLEFGDALIFELCNPARFKVYITKAIPQEPGNNFDQKIAGGNIDVDELATAISVENQDIDLSDIQEISKSWK